MRIWSMLGSACAAISVILPLNALAAPSQGNSPVSGAAFTTVNETVDGTGHCKNGNGNVNCNIYDGKQYVWLNGGPSTAYVGDGSYFFAVVEPGGQGNNSDANPNDGTSKNLSDNFDAYTNRTFTVSNGTVSYSGDHDFANNKIRLMPYADTGNPGGVYILAICSLADGYPVNPSDCKYDAFKIQQDEEVKPGLALTVTKGADGSYTQTFSWDISKDVDKTIVKQVGGNATFNYTVTTSHNDGVISAVKVNGTITVFNPNVDGNANPVAVDIDGVSDVLSDGTVCAVSNGGAQTISGVEKSFAYSCDLDALPQSALANNVSVSWSDQFLANNTFLAAGSASFKFKGIDFAGNQIDECVDVTDTFNGSPSTLGTVCVGDANPKEFGYSRSVAVPQYDCKSYTNTAAFTTTDSGATDSASQTVTVCGPAKTGALTMGFWQNPNGQTIIKNGAATANVCNSGTWVRQYAPFQNLSATANCKAVASYVYDVIKAANASGASMNAMLKAQMLATSLDVYFSDPALGGNKINAPKPIGGVAIDLTKVCKNIATCTIYENVSSAFGGASSMTVSQLLAYAASQSNVGGSVWYGQIKSMQELAKDMFDAINNQVAFGA